MNIRRKFFTAAAPLALTVSLLAQKGPMIHYKYPGNMNLLGGPSEKDIDCGTTFRFAAQPKTLFATCDFLEQVDNNGQEICSVTDPGNFGTTEREQRANLSTALLAGLRHYGIAHGMCQLQAGRVDLAFIMRGVPQNDIAAIIGQLKLKAQGKPYNLGMVVGKSYLTDANSGTTATITSVKDFEDNVLRPINLTYKTPNWVLQDTCPLVDVTNQCKEAMGLNK